MSWTHLKTLVWLRWRLSRNQWKKAGAVNAILGAMVVGIALVGSVIAFFVALVGGVLAVPRMQPDHILLLWVGITAVFLSLWTIGLVTELQRSELLSLERMLHLPLSLREAFLLNYLTSLASLSIVMFLPAMIGLSIAMVATHGWTMLLMFPLVFSFLALVTAVTYQLRGWLATLMANKRRRRAIITFITAGLILLAQIPNLINVAFQRHRKQGDVEHAQAVEDLQRQLNAQELNSNDYVKRMEQLNSERKARRSRQFATGYRQAADYALLGALIFPVGWLPYGAHALSTGALLPALLCATGMFLLATVSLGWSYRATMRFYTGKQRSRKKRRPAQRAGAVFVDRAAFLQRKIPGVSEQASTVALASLRSLLRAPEAKMALLTPVIMVGVFGSMIFLASEQALPSQSRPFIAIAMIGVTLFGLSQLTVNLFGLDRHGFRAYILMPVPRRDILLGKNLAVLPLGLVMCLIMLVAIQFFAPLTLSHLVATLLQIVPAFLMAFLVGNTVSIYSPIAIATGALKPTRPSLQQVFMQFLAMMLMPMTLLPALASVGCELLLQWALGQPAGPIYLLVSVLEAAAAIWLYRKVLTSQGGWLQQRETRILETLAANAE